MAPDILNHRRRKMADEGAQHASGATHLALATVSLAVCFAAWGLIAAFAPQFRAELGLSATETALLVAVPVLLGSLARLPIGMLADRFGGRAVFPILMLAVSVPAFLTPLARSYSALLWGGFFLGLAGSSFAVGAGFTSRCRSTDAIGGCR
jgi:NNP family nitrate/nitrite transporter-like MFS transporter